MNDHPRLYLAGAFVLGVFITVCWNEYSNVPIGSEKRRTNLTTTTKKENKNEGEQENKSDIREGIEGCIGRTPLIRIKSLSEATGCDILAKAEVIQ